MKTYTANYINTFIEVAEDCATAKGNIPQEKNGKRTIALLEYELINEHPYKYTSDDVLFKVYAERNSIGKEKLKEEREKFFSKGQACFRASPLTKNFGWGIHNNQDGKIALFGMDTKEYKKFLNDDSIQKVKAMRNKKK